MEPEYILFIDDNYELLKPVLDSAAEIQGLHVLYTSRVADGFNELNKNSENINAVILDLLFTGQPTQGEEALEELRYTYPNIPVVVLTESYDNKATAIRCLKNGAYDFVEKRFLNATHLFHILENAISQEKFKKSIRQKVKEYRGTNHPAVLFNSEEMACRFAYKLTSISMQTDSDLLDNLIKASTRWHYNLLHIIVSSYCENLTSCLILVKNKEKQEIDIYLVFSLHKSNEDSVYALTAEFIIAVEPYVLSLYESHTRPYVFEPVTDSLQLNKILYPQFNKSSVRLYSEPVCWGNPGDYNFGMEDARYPLIAEFLPKITSGEIFTNYNLLAQSLLSCSGTSYLCIHLQPLKLRLNEEEFLIKVIDDKILHPDEVAPEQVKEYFTRYKNIASSHADNYLFEVRYLSNICNHIPKPLDIEIKRHFYQEGLVVKSTLQAG